MRRVTFIILGLAVSLSAFSQETREERRCRRGQAAGYATRDATVLSMMGWGIGIAIGIAAICILISNNDGDTTTSS
jgi:uncharacterized membrane protein